MPYRVTIENSGGELDSRILDVNDDPELLAAVVDFLMDVGSLRDGDVIRIKEAA